MTDCTEETLNVECMLYLHIEYWNQLVAFCPILASLAHIQNHSNAWECVDFRPVSAEQIVVNFWCDAFSLKTYVDDHRWRMVTARMGFWTPIILELSLVIVSYNFQWFQYLAALRLWNKSIEVRSIYKIRASNVVQFFNTYFDVHKPT